MQGSSINVASAPKTAMFQMRINPEIKREAEDVFFCLWTELDGCV